LRNPPSIGLLRHGRIDAEPGRCVGWTDLPLSDPSKVGSLAKRFAMKIGAAGMVYTSDLQRAVQTAKPLAKALRCPLKMRKDLRELNFGRWENLTWEQIENLDPAGYQKFMDHWRTEPPPGGESYSDLKARVAGFWKDVRALDINGAIVVVGHGGSLRVLIGQIMNIRDKEAMGIQINRGHGAFINWKNNKYVLDVENF